jgi:hypothetical protein
MPKRSFRFTSAAVLVVCLGFSVTTYADSSTDEDRIAEIRAKSNQAIQDHDAEEIVSYFDETYQITTGSGLLYHGDRETEKGNWAEHFAQLSDVVYVRTPTNIDVGSYLPRAAESGKWVGTWTSEEGPIEVGGSYSASWRKIDGHWKIQSEMFVTLYCKGDACEV